MTSKARDPFTIVFSPSFWPFLPAFIGNYIAHRRWNKKNPEASLVAATGITVEQFAQEIRTEYQASEAQTNVVNEVIQNIEARQGKLSFDLAHAIRPQFQSPEVEKAFAIGLGLAIKKFFGLVFDTLKAALAKAFNTNANLVTLVNVSDENDLEKVRQAVEAAKKHNKDTSTSLAVVGVVIAKDANGTLAQSVQEEISHLKSGVPVAVVREGDLEFLGDQIPYTVLFNRFSCIFEQQRVTKAQELFYELIQDNVNDKRVIIVGVSRTPYQASERLLSIMISLVPIQGRVLMINIQSILEAAKMA